MQNLGYELRRIPLPRTWVNKDIRKSQSPNTKRDSGPLERLIGYPDGCSVLGGGGPGGGGCSKDCSLDRSGPWGVGCSVLPGPTSTPAMPATAAPAMVPRRPTIWPERPSVCASLAALLTASLVLLTTDAVAPCCPWACKSAVSPEVCAVPLD
jgi:hypothetical protein